MEVGERIKYFRQKKGITVNKLANISGISQSYLRDIELGNKQPTVEYLSYICEALGVSLSYFFDDSDESDIDALITRLTSSQKEALRTFLESMIDLK